MSEEKTDREFIEEIPEGEEGWKKELWYAPEGVYQAEIRRNGQGKLVEARNITETKRPPVASPTIGVYVALYDDNGRIIIVKRSEEVSFPGDWELAGGALKADPNSNALDERVIGQELTRLVKERVGIDISVPIMPMMFPAVIKKGSDYAFVIPVYEFERENIIKGGITSISPKELLQIAREPEGNRILSGEGKRMHRLALMGLCHSPNPDFRKEAEEMLEEIQDEFE